MQTTTATRKLGALSFAILSFIFFGSYQIAAFGAPAEKTEDGVLSATIDVPKGSPNNLALKDVKNAIVQAAVARKYQIEKSEENKIVISYERKGGQAVVFTILYDETKIKIYAKGKIIEKQVKFPARGKEKVEAIWDKGWLETLKKDIRTYLLGQLALLG